MNVLMVMGLLLQEKAAEETFKKIEETLHKAQTLRVVCKSEKFS